MDINKLISLLLAVQNYCKDIHYNCKGDAFYSKHLLADRVQENISDFIDQLKEVFFLPDNKEPLSSGEYLRSAADIIPVITGNDKTDFYKLSVLLTNTLKLIEDSKDLTKGEENLLGAIAQDIQTSLGLINMQVKE